MKKLLLGDLLLLASSSFANEVYKKEVATPHDVYMKEFKSAIEKNHMNVLYELDLIKKFKDAGYAKKFGAYFNKNKLTAATTIKFFNQIQFIQNIHEVFFESTFKFFHV